MLLLPYLAAAFDLIENGMHVYLLSDLNRVTRGAVLFSGICTNLKWTIALICLFGSAAFFSRLETTRPDLIAQVEKIRIVHNGRQP